MKKFYDKYSWLIIILLVVIILFKTCGEPKQETVPVAKKLQADLKKTTEAKKEAVATVSINTVYITKWKEVKVIAGKMPCDTAIEYVMSFCDTIIQKDTLAINSLKKVVLAQDTVILDYKEIHKSDSTTIAKLNRKLKRQKLFTKGAFLIGVATGGFVGVKLSPCR